MSGNVSVDLDYYYDEYGGDKQEWIEWYSPRCIEPPTPIFLIHKDFPDELAKLLRSAFTLYWVDRGACAAKLRVALEAFLALQGITSQSTLHAKIEAYSSQRQDVGDMLMALKWLGNSGSHLAGQTIAESDILDAFEVLEFALEEVYLNRRDKMLELAAKLSKTHKKQA